MSVGFSSLRQGCVDGVSYSVSELPLRAKPAETKASPRPQMVFGKAHAFHTRLLQQNRPTYGLSDLPRPRSCRTLVLPDIARSATRWLRRSLVLGPRFRGSNPYR